MSKQSKNDLIQPDDITVAIFCALPKEAVAVRLVFDERFDCNVAPGQQLYVYSYGRVGEHNIVLTVPHQMGTVKASQCAAVVAQQFPNIRFALSIGIGGGIPGADADIRLGDVAVSIPQDNHPGVIEYDYGKYTQNGEFVLKGSLNKPAPILISADMSLQMDEMEDEFPIDGMLQRIPQKRLFSRPSRDVLFADTFHHVGGKDCSACDNSSQKQIVDRGHRNRDVIIHRGLILSGGGVIKNPQDRNRLRRGNEQAICYEMLAAGIMGQIPCLVIRGICDYADTHKSDEWHYYAAAVAAAYGGAILMKIRGEQVRQTSTMQNMMSGMKRIESKVDEVKEESYRRQILEWIGQKNWRHAHQAHFSRYEPGTGQWFLNHPDFKKWEVGHQQTLLCQGDPGAGKTVMASVMIDHLKSRACVESAANPTAVVFFYFSAADRNQQCPPYFMLSLMRQLIESSHRPLPKAATDWFEGYKDNGPSSLSMESLISGIIDISLSFANLFIVIDALDECEESALERGLLRELFKLQSRTKVNIAATSRRLDWIKDIFKNLVPNYLLLPIEAADEDVKQIS
ncbi:hypothetical protein FVEN_g12253 [Fusarium venenatum]|uniref:nucleoside phosphorylase domain-containing protein n=1 Tax=Fusarium venenatum TaxID=56646 RepID=UPI001DEE8268|nr:hypothetical protein FVEN_g12253 [Fusarium venenatum]KAH6965009.1 nucleoside phosphorylase domain-containing protein [Fusarium venenatum]